MLADQEHAVDRQLARTQRQGIGDGGIDFHDGEFPGAPAAEVVHLDLVNPERHQVHGRLVMLAVPAVTDQEPVADMLGMSELMVDSRDGGDLRAARGGGLEIERRERGGGHQLPPGHLVWGHRLLLRILRKHPGSPAPGKNATEKLEAGPRACFWRLDLSDVNRNFSFRQLCAQAGVDRAFAGRQCVNFPNGELIRVTAEPTFTPSAT